MKITKLLLILLIGGFTTAIYAQNTAVIAHRGFWKTNGSAQNSIAALMKADSIHCYGSEFDVWLTKDNKLVINHDPLFKLKSMELSKASTLRKLKLSNGESLPMLKAFFKEALNTSTKLILEFKPHSKPERETKAIEKIIKMVNKFKLNERIEYITFSKHALKELIRLAPQNTPVYYLAGDLTPQELKTMGCAGLDYHISVIKKHPEWIVEAHQLGMKVNVWTIDKEEDMKWLIEKKVDFITTNEPLLLQQTLK